jgi:hypothetical protein
MCGGVGGGGGEKKEEQQQEEKGRGPNIFRSPTHFPLPVVPFSRRILGLIVPCCCTPIEYTVTAELYMSSPRLISGGKPH